MIDENTLVSDLGKTSVLAKARAVAKSTEAIVTVDVELEIRRRRLAVPVMATEALLT